MERVRAFEVPADIAAEADRMRRARQARSRRKETRLTRGRDRRKKPVWGR